MNVQDLIQAAATYGATVEQDDGSNGWKVYQVVAPEGQLWVDGGCASLRVEWHEHGKFKQFRDDAIREGIARVVLGTYDDEEFA